MMPKAETLVIRDMTEADVAAVAQLAASCFADAWSERIYRTELNNPYAITLIAEQNGDLIGYLNAGFVLDEVSVNSIAVRDVWRRCGVARTLLESLERRTAAFAATLLLEVRASNEAAMRLYTQFGFERVGLRKRYYHDPEEDAVLMTKFLSGIREGNGL